MAAATPQTIDEYMAALPATSQEIIAKIRAMVSLAAPDAVEKIKYGMPTAVRQQTSLIYYAAWKTHIALYPIYPGSAEFEAKVGPYRHKKDTLRFRLKEKIPFEIIQFVLDERVANRSNRNRRQHWAG